MKIAYLIGNSEYENWGKLRNPINDLNSMEKVLDGLGYMIDKFQNLNSEEFNNVSKTYKFNLYDASESIFYYSGHGIEANGKLYLIPIDGKKTNEDGTVTTEILKTYIDITNTVNEFPHVDDYVNIFVFDCCREFCNIIDLENKRGIGNSEKMFNAKQGKFISFSTSPNATASDGKGDNGLFTKYLVKNIIKPDLRIEDVFKEVRVSVMKESNNKQIPWEHSSLIGDFSFISTKSVNMDESITVENIAQKLYAQNVSYVELNNKVKDIYINKLKRKNLLINNKLIKSEKELRKNILEKIDELYFKEGK